MRFAIRYASTLKPRHLAIVVPRSSRLFHEPSNALAADYKLACLPSVPRTAMVNAEIIGHAAPPKEEAVELSERSDTLARTSRDNYNAVKGVWT